MISPTTDLQLPEGVTARKSTPSHIEQTNARIDEHYAAYWLEQAAFFDETAKKFAGRMPDLQASCERRAADARAKAALFTSHASTMRSSANASQ